MAKEIGKISHYYSKIAVGIVELKAPLALGDKISVKGHSTDFTETVSEMQVNHKNIESAKKGESVGIKVKKQVREGDVVSKEE